MAGRAGDRTPYWTAARLAGVAVYHWADFDGWCASRGVDPESLPPHRALNLVHYWALRLADPKRRAEFEAWLDRPPPDADPADSKLWSAEAEMAAFRQAASTLQ